jgi:tectonin beta-propeller repeat-containing protein 1
VAKCKLKGISTYEDCVVELEWISSDCGSFDYGTLTILNADGATTLVSKLFIILILYTNII